MILLVHHGEAADPIVDAQRALTGDGRAAVERLAREAAGRGVAPVEIWHSGKLRARQTGEAFRLACNPLAAFAMVRGLQPADPSDILADRLAGETRDLLLVGSHAAHRAPAAAAARPRRRGRGVPAPRHGGRGAGPGR